MRYEDDTDSYWDEDDESFWDEQLDDTAPEAPRIELPEEDVDYSDVDDGSGALVDEAVVIPVAQLRRLMELRAARDEAKKTAEATDKAYKSAELDLFEQLDNGPMPRLSNVDLGPPWGKVSFQRRKTEFGRVIKGMEDEAIAYYEKMQVADALTKRKLVMKRVNEDVRAALEEGQPLPPGIDYYTNRGVTVTRQKD